MRWISGHGCLTCGAPQSVGVWCKSCRDRSAREESLRSAKAKVAALPDGHRAALENEFLRAEHEAQQILHTGTQIDYVGLQSDLDELEATDPEVAEAAARLDRIYSTTCPDCGKHYRMGNGHLTVDCITELRKQRDTGNHLIALMAARMDTAETFRNAGEVGVMTREMDGRTWFALETPERDL